MYDANKEWAGKKVVLVSVPGMLQASTSNVSGAKCLIIGAFTPGCSAYHLPPYIQKLKELQAKGVDIVAVIASNDGFVMQAWGKVHKVIGDDIVRTLWER